MSAISPFPAPRGATQFAVIFGALIAPAAAFSNAESHGLEACGLAETREVLTRAASLAERLGPTADPGRLGPLVDDLGRLRRRVHRLGEGTDVPEAAGEELYRQARRLARQIAFTNPRLTEIDKLLFVKRHDPGGLFHMVHQYYGFGAKPGGGLFVLENPFSDEPEVIDLLAESRVERGRLAGRRLVPGAFLRPDVGYDGKSILFAYTEGLDEMPSQGVWSPEACYHVFRVNADGTGLVQLTDGPYNDFDPCFLPDGRVAFISERRGGFLRCGGSAPRWPSPTYTLHSMEPDGSDIITLSYHETQEWNPSVNHDGMLVYTRWDYVDRDTNVAHHKWICAPDGRDPRAFHGNYPTGRREDRPWMEMQVRAIPGSHRYVAVAAAHHGHEFGSLVLIDLRPEDDGAMSQLTRLTPEVPFPESEGRPTREYMVYGTPWPLSEDDYLVVYDGEGGERGAYNRGIYWIDRFGNRELIYRDPDISCYAPMPLRARPRPPVLPRQTVQAASDLAAAGGEVPRATIAVMNVYDSRFEWPADTRIQALRIIHVLPKTTSRVNEPRIGAANAANARAVLGTVPVEPDGSAYFEAPVGKSIYFQALDADGTAVQSMRSATYVHPGEQLQCQGCHERKHQPPELSGGVPLAMRRSPSPIEPEPEGSNPLNYVRLVQPVLDRHCVACHRKEDALDLSGVLEGPHGFTRSYNTLAAKYGFYFDSTNGSFRHSLRGGARTDVGQFGARAAKLTAYLGADHYGVKLPNAERRRLIVWLDANSDFFGAYENTAAQSRGEVVYPSLD